MLFVLMLISSYTILLLEFLAINQILPFVESSNFATAVIVLVILFFLVIGFYKGGKLLFKKNNIRNKILKNFVISTVFIFFGTTYSFLHYYFLIFDYIGVKHIIFQSFVFSMLFLSAPSYLLAQNTRLLSNYFNKNISKSNGVKVLFYGVILSFVLSIITIMFLMPIFGLNYAVFFNIFLITAAILILNKRNKIEIYMLCFLFLIITFMLNNNIADRKFDEISNDNFVEEYNG